jgi:hypothetical protein
MGEGEMPTERIYTGDGPDNPRHVHVSWGRDRMEVQLGTVKDEPALEDASGQFVHLVDRHRINQLIRVLRRARDQAFGRDE